MGKEFNGSERHSSPPFREGSSASRRIKYVRFNADKLPKAPYELIKSPLGMVKLVKDGFDVAGKINKFLKENDFDAIHVHFPFASNILLTINRDLREKVIYTAHTNEYRLGLSKSLNPPLAVRFFSPDLYLMKRARKNIVLNRRIQQVLFGKGINDERLEVVPNDINSKEFILDNKDISKEKCGLNGTIVMLAGRVTPIKGMECLIKAAEILRNKEITYLIAGSTTLDKKYAQRLIEYTNRKGIKAVFTGFVSHEYLKDLYSACDIFVLPSFEEGFGIVLTEALASGKPLIGSNVGGIPMQVRDSWNGFLIEPGNERQLANKIEYLVENEKERKCMGKTLN